MIDTYFFGYGSLVNRATHNYQNSHPATLRGWRRQWCHIAPFPRAILSVTPDAEGHIEGLIAGGSDIDWEALDIREQAYDRASATDTVRHTLDHTPDVILYTIPDEKHPAASSPQPILLSYIDVVTQGYLQVFGTAAAADFFTTTTGWGPILNDRENPIYPRHQRLSGYERGFIDEQLHALSAVVKQP